MNFAWLFGLSYAELASKLHVACAKDGLYNRLSPAKCEEELRNMSFKEYPGGGFWSVDTNVDNRAKWVLNVKTEFCKTRATEYFCPNFKPVATTTTTKTKDPTTITGAKHLQTDPPTAPPTAPPTIPTTPLQTEAAATEDFVSANLPMLIGAGVVGLLLCLCIIGVVLYMKKGKKPEPEKPKKRGGASSMSRASSMSKTSASSMSKSSAGKKKKKGDGSKAMSVSKSTSKSMAKSSASKSLA